MSDYPIPIWEGNFRGPLCLTIVCERCHAEEVIDPEEILNEGLYRCPHDTELARRAATSGYCYGTAVMKYEPADKCTNCGKVGWDLPFEHACSRRCQLQAEYAAALTGGAR